MLIRCFIIVVFSFIFTSSPGIYAEDDVVNAASGSLPIVVLGDSLSAGFGISQNESWVSLLQNRLSSKQYPYNVINASVSGETSSGGLSRLNRILAIHSPAIVILELGANDGLRGLPIQQMENNLSFIVEQSLKAKSKVLLVGMQIPPNYGPDYTNKFHMAYQNIAKKFNISLAPFLLDGVATNNNLMQSDGLHPRAEAQHRLLDNIWLYLEQLLTDR